MRSRLSNWKKLSATALSRQFPRRLILGCKLWKARNAAHSQLANWLPCSEWTITLCLGLRRHAAASHASRTRSLLMRAEDAVNVDHPGGIGCGNIKWTVQNPGRHVMHGTTMEAWAAAIASLGTLAAATHQTIDTIPATGLSRDQQGEYDGAKKCQLNSGRFKQPIRLFHYKKCRSST